LSLHSSKVSYMWWFLKSIWYSSLLKVRIISWSSKYFIFIF